MPSRYVVRRGREDQRYSVWDSAENVAHSTDLDFDDALDLADRLNADSDKSNVIPPPPSEPQHVAQQQQQPQPEDDKKE